MFYKTYRKPQLKKEKLFKRDFHMLHCNAFDARRCGHARQRHVTVLIHAWWRHVTVESSADFVEQVAAVCVADDERANLASLLPRFTRFSHEQVPHEYQLRVHQRFLWKFERNFLVADLNLGCYKFSIKQFGAIQTIY